MKRALAALTAVFVSACGGPGRREVVTPPTLRSIHDDYVHLYAMFDPNWATRQGLHEHDGELTRYDDFSHGSRRRVVQWTLQRLAELDPAALSPSDRIDYRLFLAGLSVEEYDNLRRDARTVSPDLPLGAISAVHDLLIKDFAPRERRVANAVSRLNQVEQVCADVRERLGRPPALWTRMAIDDLEGALSFLDGVPALAGGSAEAAAAAKRARRALESYRRYLEAVILPRSDGTFALGREGFEFRLRAGLLLSTSAAELAAAGEREFEKTIAMLEETARSIDAARPWTEILEEMKKDCPPAGELLATYREEIARARRFMIEKGIVGIPEEKLEVMETPEFRRSTTPFAAYDMPAPLDESRLGHFYVTPEDGAHMRSDIPGTVWHEAYPGHHLQFVYAKDVASRIRRLNDSPLLSEGWGFYCEELAHETGYYDDPKERLMQLNWRLQRAARIILDVAVHTGTKTYDEAVRFLVERVRMNEGAAKASVNAYTQAPTYFSCYMVGMLEIVRIREKLRARLGGRFTLKEFHERLLRCGNVPPALIEEELESWK